MPQSSEIGAIILAGGKALRMGGEKPLRSLRGRTLLELSADICRTLTDRIVAAVGPRALDVPTGVVAAADAPEHDNCGPLAGIAAGLAALGRPVAVVLACDLPNIPAALLRRLVDGLSDAPCAFCSHGGQPEPLVCALRVKPMLARVNAALAARELRVVPLWRASRAREFVDADLADFAPLERTFANVNTLDELQRLQNG